MSRKSRLLKKIKVNKKNLKKIYRLRKLLKKLIVIFSQLFKKRRAN
jgi:hypothetical protein